MPQTKYNLRLKGFVGGYDFDRSYVDYVLDRNADKHVDVLIDSLGGSLATALSIASAFQNHGDVAVHFVGMNASAATIASLGAKHISIDAHAMYLVHKCSMAFFEWGSLNSDQFSQLIAECQKTKDDLDKIDMNVAAMYSAKCKKDAKSLLDLMKVGGWLSAKDALDWGFVDEITNNADEPAPKLTDQLASAMAHAGMPIPNVPVEQLEKDSSFAKFLSAIASLFKSKNNTDMPQEPKPEASASHDDAIATLQDQLAEKDKTIADLQKQIDELKKAPGDSTTSVVENNRPNADDYTKVVHNAIDMFNAIS